MARKPKAAAKPADDWNTHQGETAGEHSADASQEQHQEPPPDPDDNPEFPDQDEGEHGDGDAPDDDVLADLAARSNVDHDAGGPETVYQNEQGDGIAVGMALTDRQRAGLDPVDGGAHAEQADDRSGLTNMQTDHERTGALDAVSGGPNPGVTANVRHSVPGKAGANDMSGRPPMPDPLAGIEGQAREAMRKLQDASKKAHASGRPDGHGWCSLQQLGVSKATMDALVGAGIVHQDTRPGGQFSPDTGTVYRVADHDR